MIFSQCPLYNHVLDTGECTFSYYRMLSEYDSSWIEESLANYDLPSIQRIEYLQKASELNHHFCGMTYMKDFLFSAFIYLEAISTISVDGVDFDAHSLFFVGALGFRIFTKSHHKLKTREHGIRWF